MHSRVEQVDSALTGYEEDNGALAGCGDTDFTQWNNYTQGAKTHRFCFVIILLLYTAQFVGIIKEQKSIKSSFLYVNILLLIFHYSN